MRIGITALFRGSAFSSSLPQVAVYLSRVLTDLGHEVEFILPHDSDDWFIDCKEAALCPRVKIVTGAAITVYHLLIEVVWHLPPNIRSQIASKTVLFVNYPAVFYDIETSVYPMASLNRDFTGVDVVWTWSHFKKTDFAYLELISKKPVFAVPFLWDPIFSDLYIKEASVVMSSDPYEVIICESNESNTSNCTLPLTVLSEIYKKTPVKWAVLNSEKLVERPFFVNNIIKNLNIDQVDISGNFCKRIRLPDLLRRPAIIISHQRWRPLKYMLVDALYLGIPIVHNCELLRGIAGGEFYPANRISQAIVAWNKIIDSDKNDLANTRKILLSRFGLKALRDKIGQLIESSMTYTVPIKGKMQLAFLDMWVDFQPSHNMIVSALKSRGISFDINQESPNLIIFGPFGEDNTKSKWAKVPKIFYTGEPLKPLLREDIVLNLGFRRNVTFAYFRFPLWMTELNWFNEDAALFKNPTPFPLELFDVNIYKRDKFCAFVASNPKSVQRNSLYNILNRYKKVDSAGRLFSNMEPIKGGLGGAGGQIQKVEFYKQYKFALVCENSQSNGYLTEKLLHAKLAGCVPIYWGDPYVELDFNPDAFVNVSKFSNVDAFLSRIKDIDENHDEWLKIAKQPLILNIDKCKLKLGLLADKISECFNGKAEGGLLGKEVVGKEVVAKEVVAKEVVAKEVDGMVGELKEKKKVSFSESSATDLLNKENCGTIVKTSEAVTEKIYREYPINPINNTANRIVVTCCNHKFVPCAVKLVHSSKYPVYVWGFNISNEDKTLLERVGAVVNEFDTSWLGYHNWSEFWNIEYYGWKSLMLWLSTKTFNAGTTVLYLDSAIDITNDLNPLWTDIDENDIFALEMPEHKMKVWSHPTFCNKLKMTEAELNSPQYSANIIGFKVGGKYDAMFHECLKLASDKEILAGQKWHQYSSDCFGHRHDQSIISLLGLRNGVVARKLRDYAGEQSNTHSSRVGLLFYVHRGLWKSVTPIAEHLEEIFLINLEHRVDRLERFCSTHPSLKNSVYVEKAVYGNKLTLNKDLVHLFRNNDFNWKKGVIGCALSHYKLWKDLSDHRYTKSYLILEDDVTLDPNFLFKWRNIAHLMPSDADVVFLGGVLPPNKQALPSFTENINEAFAKVRKMRLGDSLRRYFHFCTYSYVITKAGAKKLCSLIEERGIFTSIDHMMVNHGDSLLNIYFTTPLLAGCFQDQDPAYINADFNNFNRIDKFDSEIWNNVEHFTNEDILRVSENRKTIRFIYFEPGQKDCIEQEWLEEIFNRRIEWVDAAASVDNGIVVVYYQHTTPVAAIEGWINRHSDCSILLFHASDESCKADVTIYKHPLVKTVFRNYWRPDCIEKKVIHLPLGYQNGRNGIGLDSTPIRSRQYAWSFAGAMDRKGRLEQLDSLSKEVSNCKIHKTPTWNSPLNLNKSEYVGTIRESKFVPCLTGFYNVESYRFYETLENGSVPIIPLDEKNSYNNIFNGCVNAPLLALTDMSMLGKVISLINSNDSVLELIHGDLTNWWKGYKLYLSKLVCSRIE